MTDIDPIWSLSSDPYLHHPPKYKVGTPRDRKYIENYNDISNYKYQIYFQISMIDKHILALQITNLDITSLVLGIIL